MEDILTFIKNIKLNSINVRDFLELETYHYAEETKTYEDYLKIVLNIFKDVSFTNTYTKSDLINDIETFYKAIA